MNQLRALDRFSFRLPALISAGVLTLLLASTIAAQEDQRWLPWQGCWTSIQDTGAEDTEDTLLCLRPMDGGVEMVSMRGAEVASVEPFVADGNPQPVEGGGCVGSRSADFSEDSERVFIEEEVVCEGARQVTSGMIAMLSPTEWVDIRHVSVDGRESSWVQNYRIAGAEATERSGFDDLNVGRDVAVRTHRWRASAPVDTDDVVEASGRVTDEVISAWISEQYDSFDLDAGELVRLADAGVQPEVIDMMIAVSYPQRFAVADEFDESDRRYAGYGGTSLYYDPYFSSFGYSRLGYYGRFGFAYRPVVRVVGVRPGSSLTSRAGQLVKGRGYTQRRGSSGATTTSSGGSSGSAAAGRATTGRRAKPRRSGGGLDM